MLPKASGSAHHRKQLRTSTHQSDFRALASSAGTLGPGLVIQRGERMFLFQAWPRVVNNCRKQKWIKSHSIRASKSARIRKWSGHIATASGHATRDDN